MTTAARLRLRQTQPTLKTEFMPNKDTPFARITKTSRRLNIALFGALPFLFILASGFSWGFHRVIEQEQEALSLDFATLIGYVRAQEQFLDGLRAHRGAMPHEGPSGPALKQMRGITERPGVQMFSAQNTPAEMAFSLACKNAAGCSNAGQPLTALGTFLANYYSSYWATSNYPASAVFMLDVDDGLSLSVPAVGAPTSYKPLLAQTYFAVTDAAHAELQTLAGLPAPSGSRQLPLIDRPEWRQGTHWFRTDALPGRMLGLTYAILPQQVWPTEGKTNTAIYIVTLLNQQRIYRLDSASDQPLYDAFWLSHKDAGPLIGAGSPPPGERDGARYTMQGMVLRLTDATGAWTGTYLLSYGTFLRDNLWLPLGAGLLLLVGLIGGTASMRWYNRRVMAPALLAQREIVEKEEFSRTLIETAPVALCVLARPSGDVVFANGLAQQWLDLERGGRWDSTPEVGHLLRSVLSATGPGSVVNLHTVDGRALSVAHAPTRFNNEDVLLCVFSDVTGRAAVEEALAQAKREADKSNQAKSKFLATMSHEIRTPLYGVLGTMELLSLTELDAAQRQHLARMQDSSSMLLKIISDVLDTTRIESGQLALDLSEFSPRILVQECIAAYAGMAQQKGLLLFCCTATAVPEWLIGDAVRVRQILSNLLSNAIKFCRSGHVIVRLELESLSDEQADLRLQVVDTGVGIGKPEQSQLFLPFYQIDSGSHAVRGAGLGLSICASLAKLMGGEISVTSELGLGSSFSLKLPLQVSSRRNPVVDLKNARVLVRGAHHELTANVCQWLRHWNAHASPAPSPLPDADADDILLDVHYAGPSEDLHDWPGHHILAAPVCHPGSDKTICVSPALDPIATAVQNVLRTEREGRAAPKGNDFGILDLSVLVVEDNPINRTMLGHQLQQLGCRATLCTDGEEALTLWELSSFSVILTDVNMPRMDGYAMTRQLRARGVTVPIVGVTANAMQDEEARCQAAGMTSVLIKPIDLETLYQHLKAISTRRPAISPLPTPEARSIL